MTLFGNSPRRVCGRMTREGQGVPEPPVAVFLSTPVNVRVSPEWRAFNTQAGQDRIAQRRRLNLGK